MKVANIVLNDFTNDSRVLKISKTLGKSGANVTVFAMHNEGLAEFSKEEFFTTERVKLSSRKWSKRRIIQVVKYIEFIFRTFSRTKGYDHIHCNDLNSLPIGVMRKLASSKVKLIYDAHEYETEMNGVKGVEKKIIKIMEKLLIGFADKVITVSDSIAEEYVRLYNIEKPHLVLNCPAYIDVSKNNLFRESFAIHAEQKIFLYQGALNKGRGIEILLEAFKKLNDSKKVLVVMGYGELERMVKLEADNSANIFFQPAVKPEVVLNYTSSADFGVSFIEDSCLSYRYCLPNKMFEYTMAGLPVLVSNLVEMKKFVEEHSVGVVSDENTVNGFYDAFSKIEEFDYESLKSNLKKVRKSYCWESQEVELLKAYKELV